MLLQCFSGQTGNGFKVTFTYAQFLKKGPEHINSKHNSPILPLFQTPTRKTTNHQSPVMAGNYPKLYYHQSPWPPLPISFPHLCCPISIAVSFTGLTHLKSPRTYPASCLYSLCSLSPAWNTLRAALWLWSQRRGRKWSQTEKSWVWVSSPPLTNCVVWTIYLTSWSFHIFVLKIGRGSALPYL